MRIKTMIISTAVTVLLTGGVAVGAVYATHPRDEKAYLLEVGTHLGSRDHWAKQYTVNSPQFFLTQGNQACDWLGHQQIAVFKSGNKYRLDGLTTRYAATATRQDYLVWGGSKQHVRAARTIIAHSAFQHLCGATLQFRSSHLGGGK